MANNTSLHATDDAVLRNFRANLNTIMRSQGLSEAELSALAGFEEEDALSGIMRGTSLPNIAIPVRLADALGVPVEALLRDVDDHLRPRFEALPVQEVNRQASRLLSSVFSATHRSLDIAGDRPPLDAIVSWWKETGGDLSCGDRIAPHYDLVSAADALSALPRVHRVGPQSLCAAMLGSAENARLERFLETLSASDLNEMNCHIRSVSHSGVGMITPLKRVVSHPRSGETISVSFVRLMLPVKDHKGRQFVLNYSTLLSEDD